MRLASIVLLALLAACAPPLADRDAERDVQQPRSPREQMRYETAIAERRVLWGMSKEEVLKSWGPPMRKKRTRYRGRVRENWVYRYSDIFFDSGGYVTGTTTAAR